jgi:hypothetical protein
MQRKIHIRALVALFVVLALTTGALVWLWKNSLANPSAIICSGGGYAPPSCSTDFGTSATLICAGAAPVIGWLVYKAFFSKVGRK